MSAPGFSITSDSGVTCDSSALSLYCTLVWASREACTGPIKIRLGRGAPGALCGGVIELSTDKALMRACCALAPWPDLRATRHAEPTPCRINLVRGRLKSPTQGSRQWDKVISIGPA